MQCENTDWRCDIWQIVLSVVLLGAVIADLRTYRIPNRLTVSGILLGIGLRWYGYGIMGAGQGIAGCMIAVSVLFVLFLLRVLGAGDIKLLAAVGAFTGFGIWRVLLYTCVCAGIFGIAKLLSLRVKGRKSCPDTGFFDGRYKRTRMHMSLPIALGSVIFMAGG